MVKNKLDKETKMNRKLKNLALFLFLLFLVACGGNDDNDTSTSPENVTTEQDETAVSVANNSSSSQNDQETVVTFAVNEFEKGLYEGRIEAFEQANPGIRIELVGTGEITGNSFGGFGEYTDENIIDLVKSADVIAMTPNRKMIEQGLILDLTPLMVGDEQFDVNDFYPQVLARYQQGGGTWAMPLTASYGVIAYDKARFDAAGIEYPQAGWTWADFVSKAQALTVKDGENVQWGFNPGNVSPLNLIEAKAERPFIDNNVQPATVNLDAPEVVAAFQWYADLAHLHEVMPAEENMESDMFIVSGDASGSLNNSGDAAMWLETTDFINGDGLEADNLGVVPYPVASAESMSSPISSAFGLGNTFVMSAGSSKTDAAWAWLKFLSQQSAENAFFASASLPARQSAAEASGFWNDMPSALADTLRYASEHAFNPSALAGETEYAILPEIIQAQKDVQSVLANTQTTIENELQKESDTIAEATAVPEFEVASPPSEQVPEGAAVIRFVVMAGLIDSYRELAQQFQEQHPDIVVKVEEPNFMNESFSIAGLVGEADCFQSFSSLDNPEDLQAVISIQPFIDSDPELNEADFYPTVLDGFRKQGQLMGLPGEVSVRVLAFDKEKFDAAGRPYPNPDWTMEEFLETAVAMTQGEGENKIYGFRPATFEQSDLLLMMAQYGAKLIDDATDPPQTTFTHPDTIAAMRWYSNLYTEYAVKPAPSDNGFGNFSIGEDFGNVTNAAMWANDSFGGAVFIGSGPDELGHAEDTRQIGYVPYPSNSGSAGYENATGLFISAKTEQRQACWEWIKYLATQPTLALDGIPAHIEASESDAYAQLAGAEKAMVFRDILNNSGESSELSRFARAASWMSLTSFLLDQAHSKIVSEGISVEQAMQEAQSKSEALRSCVIEQDAFTDNEKQFNCLQELDPSLFG